MENITIIIAIATALAALLTSLATLFMILESKKQRVAISKPILKVLAENRYTIACDNVMQNRKILKLTNFGAGPALDIIAFWDINLEKIINTIKSLDPNIKIEFDPKNDFISFDKITSFINIQRTLEVAALPVSKSNILRIPTYYIQAIEEYYKKYMKLSSEEKIPKKINDFPEIYIKLEYKEINGVKQQQKFKILPNVVAMHSKEIWLSFDIQEII